MVNHPKPEKCYPIRPDPFLSLPSTATAILFLHLLGIVGGCAAVNKPASLLVSEVEKIEEALHQIEMSYRQRDETHLFPYLNASSEQTAQLKEQILQDFTAFSEIEMTMRVIRVDKTQDQIQTTIYWEGTWLGGLPSSSSALHQSGNALFIWSLDESPKLLEVRGNRPWGYAPSI